MKNKSGLLTAVLMCWASPLSATTLPATTTDTFCADVQKILTGTDLESDLTVYEDIAAYRKSKLTLPPLAGSQYVWLDERNRPKMVSCKIKTADHLRDEYGEDAAGEQRPCRDITLMVQDRVAAKLEAEDPSLAATVRDYVIEPDVPFTTGRAYLTPFPLTYPGCRRTATCPHAEPADRLAGLQVDPDAVHLTGSDVLSHHYTRAHGSAGAWRGAARRSGRLSRTA